MPLADLPAVSITGTGLFTPPHAISNAELAASLTESALKWNAEHAEEIAAGELAERPLPDEEFIVKASGIKSRFVVEKTGVLDPAVMRPHIPERPNEQLSVMAEFGMHAAKDALEMLQPETPVKR